jgi:hypothetical protein
VLPHRNEAASRRRIPPPAFGPLRTTLRAGAA